MKSAVIVFPGSNCDRDAATALANVTGQAPHMVWYQETSLPPVDLIVVPGGFSYGDYLRSGAMAARSPVMQAIREAASRGVFVLGICNGFQILTEAGLLPGALVRNQGVKFASKLQHLRVETTALPFTSAYQKGQVITFPIAHGDGCYTIDADGLKQLNDRDLVAFRYADSAGNVSAQANPNGSIDHIAGVLNEQKNVLGLMPHPERAADAMLGRTDGTALFQSLLAKVL
jgi:phosphoribosylformylglycinamidine synthase I